MYIPLNVFAGMLGLTSCELLQAVRTTCMVDNMHLPKRRQVRGIIMFEQSGVIKFLQHRTLNSSSLSELSVNDDLISLDDFARRANVIPLELWLAASTGKALKGVLVPSAAGCCAGQLMFRSADVINFLHHREALTFRSSE